MIARKYYNYIILFIFLAIWLWSGWHPADRVNWLAENQAVFYFMPFLLWLIFYFRLSKLSLTLILTFLTLHVIGTHYNYGFVPFGNYIEHFFHSPRNSYDRFVHFFFGFLMSYPISEVFLSKLKIKGFLNYYFIFAILLSSSAIYEIFEWVSVSNLNPHVGYLFIGGTDPFDCPKDMLMAALGSIAALSIIALIRWLKKDKDLASNNSIVTK